MKKLCLCLLPLSFLLIGCVPPPVLTEVTPIGVARTYTPVYTFSSTAAGSITYSGSCSSSTTTAVVGNNTVTFDALGNGTYSDCTIIVTDQFNQASAPLSISGFTISWLTRPLNDTGTDFCGDYAHTDSGTDYDVTGSGTFNNDLDCDLQSVIPTQTTDGYEVPATGGDIIRGGQDVFFGRDADENTNSNDDGYKGFSYTKINAYGSALLDQSQDYASEPWVCIQDNVTGLMWEVKTTNGLQNKLNTYSWYMTSGINDGGLSGTEDGGNCSEGTGCDTEKYVNDINSLNNGAGLCGNNNWRVPTVIELMSILKNTHSDRKIESEFFPNIVSTDKYWTSISRNSNNNANAFLISFGNGVSYNHPKDTPLHLRLVSGSSSTTGNGCQNKDPNFNIAKPDDIYTDHEDGTVTDNETGLMWQKCSLGLSGSDCLTGIAQTTTWQAALAIAIENSEYGYSDWRLPNKNELASLVDPACTGSHINSNFFPNTMPTGYWTSSPIPFNSYAYGAWKIGFEFGTPFYSQKSNELNVRLVRNDPTTILQGDSDTDGILDSLDNCPNISNRNQEDFDNDGIGDICDPDHDNDGVLDDAPDNCPLGLSNISDANGDGCDDILEEDTDGDGVLDTIDNCPLQANSDQANHDSDSNGDACDIDDDNDGVPDTAPDDCPLGLSSITDANGDGCDDNLEEDSDGDGIINSSDNCFDVSNPWQEDFDVDGTGDICDPDDDNDGVLDTAPDNCPFGLSPILDTNHDGCDDNLEEDTDTDGTVNGTDNCINVANPGQEDFDNDNTGDACDIDIDDDGILDSTPDLCLYSILPMIDANGDGCADATDSDADGWLDDDDNCPAIPNPVQEDFDGDAIGDACDPDLDNDGVPEDGSDLCIADGINITDIDGDGCADFHAMDLDTDSILDSSDNCPLVANGPLEDNQADFDMDAIGDACDADMDNDGVLNASDGCPFSPLNITDIDGDGCSDYNTLNQDGDFLVDSIDNCPFTPNDDQADFDSDTVGDACDNDDDNDSVLDGFDNCPYIYNPSQSDYESDGIGDACDTDDDNDGVLDQLDSCQLGAIPVNIDANSDGCDDVIEPLLDIDGDGVDENINDQCIGAAGSQIGITDFDRDGCDDITSDNDDDGDTIEDGLDLCPTSTPPMSDIDANGCNDITFDQDGDSISDIYDNCIFLANTDQSDYDGDGAGDACDIDDDNDGVAEDGSDLCPLSPSLIADINLNGCDDAFDDDDGDSTINIYDNCPLTFNPDQADYDGDGVGEACDPDHDNDGIIDAADMCLFSPAGGITDFDANGCDDSIDDDDSDGIRNAFDNCPMVANHNQLDSNTNGIGDACEP